MKEDAYCKIYLLPYKKIIFTRKGNILINALIESGIYVESPCGGKGICGKCLVMVLPQEVDEDSLDLNKFSKELACQYVINTDITVNVPENFISDNRKQLLAKEYTFFSDENRIKKTFLHIIPQKTNSASDQEVIERELKKIDIKYPKDLEVLRKLPGTLRKANYDITIVSSSDTVIDIEEGNTTECVYGIAFDIGTTTIVGTIMDLRNGMVLASESSDNPQRVYGADVISRISYVQSEKNGLITLYKIIINDINDIINKLAIKCKINKKFIYAVSFLGNTTMMHILLNITPINLAINPYVPVYKFINCFSAKELEININHVAKCIIGPNIAGFVGADTVGAMLATEFIESKKVKLLIDIGTNCEIVLGSKEKGFVTCSAAAGPAFEGAEIKFGMRAVPGTIERVQIADDVHIKTIGNIPPIGICGSGLIDAVSELLKCKIINSKGVFQDKSHKRLVKINNEQCFILSYKENNDIDEDIIITQKDIRQVQLAKGAILAGIHILQNLLNISDEEISEIQLAGAFGSYIRKESVCNIGMLPKIELNKIIVVGNAAGVGAQKILISNKYYEEAIKIAMKVKYIELSTSIDFTKVFLKCLNFPDAG